MLLVSALTFFARPCRADDLNLEEDDNKDTSDTGFGEYKPAEAPKPKGRTFSLEECLALVDRNHPNLWAARARVARARAQLDEAKWSPFSQFFIESRFGVLPALAGTPLYNSPPVAARNPSFSDNLGPMFQAQFSGGIPLYTFGKIDAGRKAATAGIRVQEWDLEGVRMQTRSDTRRAYFGLLASRDAQYIATDVLERIDKAIESVSDKLESGDTSVEEIERLRLQVYRDEVLAQSLYARRQEAFALAVLRFFTGVQTNFDIPDEPIKRPSLTLAPVARYLTAARLFRPDINKARAGVEAKRALVDLARARMFPDVGVGVGAGYAIAPQAVRQDNAWANDGLNLVFPYAAFFGARWNLDLLGGSARVSMAESELEETRAFLRLALGGVAVEVENAYATVVEAKGREESWDRAEHHARQWISTVQDAIDLGTKDERSLIEPLRAYVNSRVQHVLSLMDYHVALGELARISGWDSSAPNP